MDVDSAFTQQRLFGWQPILTPYNVLPVLFILGLIFVPLGVVFLTASMGVIKYFIKKELIIFINLFINQLIRFKNM